MKSQDNSDKEMLLVMGTNIKAIRRKKKVSQEFLAEKAGIHRNYVISLEKGRQNPSLLVVKRIAETLKVSVGKLLTPSKEK